jgi:hypothetical protein
LIVSKVIQPAPFAAIYGLLQGPPKKGAKAPDGAKSMTGGPEKVGSQIGLVKQLQRKNRWFGRCSPLANVDSNSR